MPGESNAALMQRTHEYLGVDTRSSAQAVLPEGRVKSSLRELGDAGSWTEANERRLDPKAVVDATAEACGLQVQGAFLKKVRKGFLAAETPDSYSLVLETLSILAAAGDLFTNMDRLANLFDSMRDSADGVAYRPFERPNLLATAMLSILTHYDEKRLEMLLASAFEVSRTADWVQWFEAAEAAGMRTARPIIPDDPLPLPEVPAGIDVYQLAAQVAEDRHAANVDEIPHDAIVAMIVRHQLVWSDEVGELVKLVRISPELYPVVRQWVRGEHLGNEWALFASRLQDLRPNDRPVSPFPVVLMHLKQMFQRASSRNQGLTPADYFPEKPKCFADLLPKVPETEYQIPEEFLTTFDGAIFEAPASGPVRIEILKDSKSNKDHGDYMGHCTHSMYNGAAMNGTKVIARIHLLGPEQRLLSMSWVGSPNGGSVRRYSRCGIDTIDVQPGAWYINEVEGRRVSGDSNNVPRDVVAAIDAMTAAMYGG